jgi:hypothetical protein
MQVEAQTPPAQTCCAPQEWPQVPQFWLSLATSAQKGTPASCPQRLWPTVHVEAHAPEEQIFCGPHVFPQAPQFALSLPVSAQ